jgi:hypothetical protein
MLFAGDGSEVHYRRVVLVVPPLHNHLGACGSRRHNNADPWYPLTPPPCPGLKILSVYMSGSKNMSYDSASLTTPDIKWLGVRPSDLNKYKVAP